MTSNGRYDTPPGFRPGRHLEKIKRLSLEMARKEKEWTEMYLRALLPSWVIYTLDRWNMTLPCQWYTKLRRIELAKRVDKDGATIQILVGGKVVRQGKSRVEGTVWKITEIPVVQEENHGS